MSGLRKNLAGQRFGKLTVLDNYEFRQQATGTKRNRTYWECKCDCGNTGFHSRDSLLSGSTLSCGCLVRSGLRGNFRHGQKRSRLYNIWSTMVDRCENPNNKSYPNYGGRGIKVCTIWRAGFINFYNWALANGYQEDLTIDRINNELGYSPENCKWNSSKEQGNNKRNNRYITYNGITKTLSQWSDFTGMSYKALHIALKRGKTIEDILIRYNKLNELRPPL